MRKFILILFISLICFGCGEDEDVSEQLIGVWKLISLDNITPSDYLEKEMAQTIKELEQGGARCLISLSRQILFGDNGYYSSTALVSMEIIVESETVNIDFDISEDGSYKVIDSSLRFTVNTNTTVRVFPKDFEQYLEETGQLDELRNEISEEFWGYQEEYDFILQGSFLILQSRDGPREAYQR